LEAVTDDPSLTAYKRSAGDLKAFTVDL
jgi:hypothetical protein